MDCMALASFARTHRWCQGAALALGGRFDGGSRIEDRGSTGRDPKAVFGPCSIRDPILAVAQILAGALCLFAKLARSLAKYSGSLTYYRPKTCSTDARTLPRSRVLGNESGEPWRPPGRAVCEVRRPAHRCVATDETQKRGQVFSWFSFRGKSRAQGPLGHALLASSACFAHRPSVFGLED